MDIPRSYDEAIDLEYNEIMRYLDNLDVMRLTSKSNITVAHTQASRGFKFKNSDILKLSTNSNWSVAHTMASAGHIFHDPEILKLTDSNGCTVADVMSQYIHRETYINK